MIKSLIVVILSFASSLIPAKPGVMITPRLTAIPAQTTSIPTPPPIVTISLEGDLGLGRNITAAARARNDFSWSFQKIAPFLQSNDLNLANLESPIIAACPEGHTGTFTFCGDERFLPYLKENKFFVNLANNHILNYGQSGLNQTRQFLTDSQVPFVYSHQPSSEFTTQTINGITFGFLGYDFVTHVSDQSVVKTQLLANIKKYKPQVDWLIVMLHWGAEYQQAPEKWKIDLAHQMVDAGADIIHGTHPHVWQPPETYKGKLIYYSLGNFIFDQSWSPETSHSKIVRLTLSKTEVLKQEIIPFAIKFNAQPQLEL